MFRSVVPAAFAVASLCSFAAPTHTVNCDAGQSLNRTLAKMDKFSPATVAFTGTCTEYVVVDGFNNLTLTGLQGAVIQQPATNPPDSPGYVFSVKASRSVTLSGFAVHSQANVFSSIGIGKGSADIVLRDISTDGSWGIVVYENSQAWLVRVTANLVYGFAAISAFDKSDVHIVDGLLERPANGNFNAGLLVSSGHVTMQGTTIRDMQQGISINASGSVDAINFDATAGGGDVTIENPSGKNYNGAIVSDGSLLNLENVKLRITNAGQAWGGDTGGVLVTNGSVLEASSNLVVSGSQSQGVVVSNNSHAELGGSTITGSARGGLVVVNLSTAAADPSNPSTVIGGNGTDLFCDSRSQIAGALNIVNAVTVQCNSLLPGNYENLP